MKTKKHLARWLAVMLLSLIAGAGAMAQGPGGEPSDTPAQTVCPGETQPYAVYPGDAGNTFLWTITPGTDGIEWSILSGQGTPSIQVDWSNPVTPTIYTVTLRETNPVDGCYTEVDVVVTVNPAPNAPISGGDITECEEDPIQTITATATVPAGFSIVWYDAATNGNVVSDPSLSAVGSVTYYAEAVDASGTCTSLTRTAVILTITEAPDAPVSGGDITECEEDPIQTITATATVPVGFSIVWYDAATNGNVVSDPSLSAVGSVTYYAEAVDASGTCTSLTRTAVVLTINPAPTTSPIWHN